MGSYNSDWGRVTFWISTSWRCKLIGPIYATKNYPSSSVPRFGDRWIFQIEGDRCLCHTSSLLMGNSCLWGGFNCGTCRFPHPPGNLSLVIYCYRTRGRSHHERTWHIQRLSQERHVQGVIEAMSSSSASGCPSTLVDLQQWLADRAWWIYGWINPHPIVNRVFNQVVRDHPDLHHAVNAQVSIWCQSFKWFTLKNGDHG